MGDRLFWSPDVLGLNCQGDIGTTVPCDSLVSDNDYGHGLAHPSGWCWASVHSGRALH